MEGSKSSSVEVISDNQLLVDMSLHPTPLQEKNPLSLDLIKKEEIKGFDDHLKYNPNIIIKEEVDLNDRCDSNDQQTAALDIMHEKNDLNEEKLQHCTAEDVISKTLEMIDEGTFQNYELGQCTVKSEFCESSATHSGDNMYTCSICKSICKNGEVDKDLTTENYKCGNCHTSSSKTYKCSLCEKSFCRKADAKRHEKVHTGSKPYKCNVCEKSFSYLSTLKQHRIIHTDNKPYQCSFCEKPFFRKFDLNMHERIHTGSKPFKCNVCEISFSRMSNLRQHEKIHTDIKSIKCRFCEKLFIRKSDAKRHEKIHAGSKPHKCSVCNKSFNELYNLRQHEIIHSDNKPPKVHQCRFCGKLFYRKSDSNKHERLHIGSKPP